MGGGTSASGSGNLVPETSPAEKLAAKAAIIEEMASLRTQTSTLQDQMNDADASQAEETQTQVQRLAHVSRPKKKVRFEPTPEVVECVRHADQAGHMPFDSQAAYLQDKWNNERKTCEPKDLLPIARGQMQLENKLAQKTDTILICDTDLLETKVYSEAYYSGTCDPLLEEYALKNSYELYFLTYIDTP